MELAWDLHKCGTEFDRGHS